MAQTEWFRTWFDTDYYHLLYSKRDENEARQFIDALLRFLSPRANARFIDIACGKGRHALQLSKQGFHVTGIDLSQNSIDEANEHASETLRFIVHDIRIKFPNGPYDYALNLFTSFGYFETVEEHFTVLENIYNCLSNNGRFVFDYLNIDAINCDIENTSSTIIQGVKFTTQKRIDGQHIIKSISVVDGEETYRYEEKVMAFNLVELQKMLVKIGFNIDSVHGDYYLNPFNPSQPRLIIIASKNN